MALIVQYVRFVGVTAANFKPRSEHINVYHDLASKANFLRYRDDDDAGMREALKLFADARAIGAENASINNLCVFSLCLMTLRTMKVRGFWGLVFQSSGCMPGDCSLLDWVFVLLVSSCSMRRLFMFVVAVSLRCAAVAPRRAARRCAM